MRGGLYGLVSLVLIGAIAGDLIAHPEGTAAALNGLNGLLKTSYSTALGGKKIAG
jgi:hypothetical protein